MHFVTSDIDLTQMKKADGWSEIVYGQRGNLSVWRANPGMIGSNLSVWRAPAKKRWFGLTGTNLGIWRASKGLSNIATVTGKSHWDGDNLVLEDKGSKALITPYAGSATLLISKQTCTRSCSTLGGCGSWSKWKDDSSESVVVPSGQTYTAEMQQGGYSGVNDKHYCSFGNPNQCYEDRGHRVLVQLASFVPDESGTQKSNPSDPTNQGPISPSAFTTPTAPTSPIVFMPYVVGLTAIAIVGGVLVVALKGRGKKTAGPAPSPASPKGGV